MRQGKSYNWLALLGMFVVVVLVVYALLAFADNHDSNSETVETKAVDEIEVKEEYLPKLKKINEVKEDPKAPDDNVGENDQEEIIIEDKSTDESFSSTDASLKENSKASTTYEEFEDANFDERD